MKYVSKDEGERCTQNAWLAFVRRPTGVASPGWSKAVKVQNPKSSLLRAEPSLLPFLLPPSHGIYLMPPQPTTQRTGNQDGTTTVLLAFASRPAAACPFLEARSAFFISIMRRASSRAGRRRDAPFDSFPFPTPPALHRPYDCLPRREARRQQHHKTKLEAAGGHVRAVLRDGEWQQQVAAAGSGKRNEES